jgi:hypothetical protein
VTAHQDKRRIDRFGQFAGLTAWLDSSNEPLSSVGSSAEERRGASGRKKVAMGRRASLDDPEHCWSRAQEAKVDAELMPNPDTRRLALAIAENYEQLARHLEVCERRRQYTPSRAIQFQQHPDGHGLGGIAGRSNDKGHA